MTIQEWFDKRKEAQIQRRTNEIKLEEDTNSALWIKCVHCGNQVLKAQVEDNQLVCPICDYHFKLNARQRISQLFDKRTFKEMNENIKIKMKLFH